MRGMGNPARSKLSTFRRATLRSSPQASPDGGDSFFEREQEVKDKEREGEGEKEVGFEVLSGSGKLPPEG
jgi:hypothetical protein